MQDQGADSLRSGAAFDAEFEGPSLLNPERIQPETQCIKQG
jgi:hypothetical protein